MRGVLWRRHLHRALRTNKCHVCATPPLQFHDVAHMYGSPGRFLLSLA
jgi:hypothetical protein